VTTTTAGRRDGRGTRTLCALCPSRATFNLTPAGINWRTGSTATTVNLLQVTAQPTQHERKERTPAEKDEARCHQNRNRVCFPIINWLNRGIA
jgi:hypothetical protein